MTAQRDRTPTRARAHSPRVFIGLTEVAGYFGNLEAGLRELGIDARFLDESHHSFAYRQPGSFARIANAVRTPLRRSESSRNRVVAWLWWVGSLPLRGIKAAGRCWLFCRTVGRYDAFIFGGGDSLLPRNLDLPVLKRLRKPVVWVFTGSDHRPAYLNGRAARELGQRDVRQLAAETRRVKSRVRTAERHATWIVALPSSAQFHTMPFVHFLRMGIPFHADEPADSDASPFSGRGVRVLHAPSDPVSKGSASIRQCVDNLRSRGYEIDYVEITGRPHGEILDAVRRCDLVVDEVFSDTPMAVLATEAAFFGKPTVVTGYYSQLIHEDLPAEWIPPSAFALPDQLGSALERLVSDRAYRTQLGESAAVYVHTHWNPAAVAARFLRLIEDDVPGDWIFTPDRVRYLHGWGLPEPLAREAVGSLLDAYGEDALLLAHNRPLREALVRFAGRGGASR